MRSVLAANVCDSIFHKSRTDLNEVGMSERQLAEGT